MVRLLLIFKAVSTALILMFLAAFFSGELAVADPSSSEIQHKVNEKQAKIRVVRDKISNSEKRMANLCADEAPIILELERLNLQLNTSRIQLRKIRSEIELLGGKIESLKENAENLVKEIQMLETCAVQRLVAFYKLSRLGIAPVLFSAESFLDFTQRQAALERILQLDLNLWDKLQNQKKQLEALSRNLKAQKLRQDHLFVKCKEERTTIAQKKTRRAKLLARIRSEKDLTITTIASLKRSAKELDETIRSLRLKLQSFSTHTPADSGAFLALKGSLPKPVRGHLAGLFGPYQDERLYNVKSFRSGVTIRSDLGIPVQAVSDGQVIYADWFKGYGNIIIIDHGDHYYTLSAQLEQTFKKKGDTVQAGEAIGTVGDSGTLGGPSLYFEIRHHGKPLNPALWFTR